MFKLSPSYFEHFLPHHFSLRKSILVSYPCSLPTLQGTVPRGVQNPGSSLQECPNHFKIDMHVKESCHCLFLQIVNFYLIRYGDTAMQSKVHVSRSNRAFLSPTRENGSGSRTEKGKYFPAGVSALPQIRFPVREALEVLKYPFR